MVLDPTFPSPLALSVPALAGGRRRKREAKPKAGAIEASAAPSDPPGTPEPSGEHAGAPAGKAKRKVNRSQKGTHVELLAIKVLEAEGYKVHRCVRTGIRRGPLYISQSNDVFGCVDLVAKKRGERTRWIQVTADSGIGRKKADLAEVPWDPLFDSVEIWRWVGGATRRNKSTGDWLPRQYFQVYHLDDGYGLQRDRRIGAALLPATPGGAAT